MAGELILIVEDNAKNRKLVRDVLQFKGYETIEVETGEESLRLAQDRLPGPYPDGHPTSGNRRDRGTPAAAG